MKLEISANQLSLGLQGDHVTSVHQPVQALGRDVPIAEAEARVFGNDAPYQAMQKRITFQGGIQ